MGRSPHGHSLTVLAVTALCLQLGCQAPARVVQTVLDPLEPDAQAELPTSTLPQQTLGPERQQPLAPSGRTNTPVAADSCPDSLNDRVSLRTIDLPRDVRYKLLGFENFPFDERVAFAPAPDGSAYVAWTDDSSGRVFVTPLDRRWDRAGPDIDPKSYEIGGIVAQNDGFALLTLRDPPTSTPQGSFAASGSAASGSAGASGSSAASFSTMRAYAPAYGPTVMLLRFRNGVESYASALTGQQSITQRYGTATDDYAPGFLYGRLAWNGAKYGAYFIIGLGPDAPANTDKLVYADDSGAGLPGGFTGKCSSNQGLRLWPEQDVFTPVCVSDGQPAPGINFVPEDRPPVLLAAEAADSGWSGGQMGSIVKLPGENTYFVGWLSRDVVPGGAPDQTARMASDIALLRLGSDRKVIGDKRWLVETEGAAETNLHFARYGTSQILVVWDAITDLRCDKMCFGTYAGTYARVLDREGNVIKGGRLSAVPNHHDDLVTLPNGDVAWAFVPDPARDYRAVPPSRDNVVLAPAKRTIQVARLRFCE